MRPLPSTTLSASYTWLRTRVDDAGVAAGASFLEGRALLRRPAHTVRLDARTRIARRAGFGVTVQHVGERKDVDFAPFPAKRVTLDAYTLVDLDLSVDLVRGPDGRALFGTLFRAENLLDEEYVTVVGFPGRGRALQVGGRVGF